MVSPIAVLVEDDPQQADVSKGVLYTAGFDTRCFDSIAPALAYLRTSVELIDLFVLDRRLPVNGGEPATEEFGDELLNEVRSCFPDARLIVFTGYATVRHVQSSLQGGGQLPTQGVEAIDRVTVLEKDQSLEFRGQVEEMRELLQSLDDIEIVTPDATTLTELDKRVLRRVAFDYAAASMSVAPFGGGLTGASVWRCELHRTEGLVATVVAKRVKRPSTRGGLAELLPRVSTTARLATLSGLMSGGHVSVVQIAGESPYALMDIIDQQPARAVELARPIWNALRGVVSQPRTLTVAELCKSLIGWDRLSGLLDGYGIGVPAGSLKVTTRVGPRHGDLHPGNVLIDNEQAVLIDMDSETMGAGLLDPITMLISTLCHPSSPIRGALWPSASEIAASFSNTDFGHGHVCECWFRGVSEWIDECRTSQREYWALVLAYAGRQLQFPDVLADAETTDRIVAITRLAAKALADS